MDISKLFSALNQLDFTKPSWDLFILLFFAVAVFLYGISLGRDRILVILISIYMALAVVQNAPYVKALSQKVLDVNVGFFAFKFTIFLGVFVLLFFFLSRSALLNSVVSLQAGSWLYVIIFSILHVGLLLSTILSFFPKDSLEQLLPLTREIFVSDLARFLWITLPIVAMAILPIKKKMP